MKKRYSFTCCQIFDQKWKDSMKFTTKITELVPDIGDYTLTLVRTPASCDAGFGLSRLKVHRKYNNGDSNFDAVKLLFKFQYCKVALLGNFFAP